MYNEFESKPNCVWQCLEKGCRCEVCGYPLPKTYPTAPRRECPLTKPARCKNLGSQVGEALIKCETCQGNVRLKFSTHECAVFGNCLPTYRGQVEAGHGCIGCARWEAR